MTLPIVEQTQSKPVYETSVIGKMVRRPSMNGNKADDDQTETNNTQTSKTSPVYKRRARWTENLESGDMAIFIDG